MAIRPVVMLAYPDVQSLDVVGPLEVFALATRLIDRAEDSYRIAVVARRPGLVMTNSGIAIHAEPLPDPATPIDTLILPGGTGVDAAAADPETIEWIRSAARSSTRVATVCSGTFLAAHAALLNGRTVTTHWGEADRLAREFPRVSVDSDPIHLRDGKVWSSAGVTAGIDLALAIVEEDHGVRVAQFAARTLVMFLHRPGGQTQFAPPAWPTRAAAPAIQEIQQRIETDPGGDHRVDVLAAAASMSTRHFLRTFRSETGTSPARYVEGVRMEAARRDLETTDHSLAAIARRCGFGSAETLRRVFHRHLGVTPDAYRQRFRVA